MSPIDASAGTGIVGAGAGDDIGYDIGDEATTWRTAAPVAAYVVAFLLLGLAASVSGPLLSHLKGKVGTDDTGIGLVFVAQAGGYIAGSLLSGRLVDRGRGHQGWSVATLVSTMCFGGIAVAAGAGSLALVLAVFVVLGVALGCCDVSGNTLVVWSRPGRSDPALHALHLAFAVGALASPLVANRALAWTDSVWPLAVPIGVLAMIVVVQLARHPAPVQTRVGTTVLNRRTAHPVAQWRHVAAICGFFMIYVGVEAGFAGWIHSYVEQIGYGGAGTATGITATFWTGFVVGRVAAIWLSRRIAAGWMLVGAMSSMVAAATALVVFDGAGPALWCATFGFGLTIAPQFASMISFAEERLALTGRSTSAFIASSGVGGIILPWLIGVLFDAYGARSLPQVILAGVLVCGGVAAAIGRMLPVAPRSGQPCSSAVSAPRGAPAAAGEHQATPRR